MFCKVLVQFSSSNVYRLSNGEYPSEPSCSTRLKRVNYIEFLLIILMKISILVTCLRMENPSFFVTENEMETRVGSGEAQINEIGNGKARAPRDFQGFRRNDSMLNVTQSIAIFVDSAKKSFGDVKVLENVNMRVQEGTM